MIVDRGVTVSDQLTLVLHRSVSDKNFQGFVCCQKPCTNKLKIYWHINVLLCKFLRFAAM